MSINITFDAAVEAIESGNASYNGITHTDHDGDHAIITRYDLCVTQHVADVSPEQVEQLKGAAHAKA